MAPKQEDTIETGKNAVAALRTVSADMAKVLQRVQDLEAAIKAAKYQADRLSKAFGPDVYLNVYDGRGYSPKAASELFKELNTTLTAVL